MAQILSEQDIIRLEELEYSKDEGREEGIEIGLNRGRNEGREEGKIEERKNLVLKLYDYGMDIDSIVKATKFEENFVKEVINSKK